MDFSKTIIRRLAPAAAALVVFFVVSAAYFAPQFRGEVLPQHDVVQYEGMAKDISDMRAATGEDPQWTGGMFGGMPAFLINVAYPAQIVKRTVGQVVKLIDTPAAFLFFAMTAMWLMLLVFGVDPWVGIVPALAYGLSTYFLLIIGAGHITKMWALVYAPLMMGGAWMTLRGNMWAGGALTALTASLEIGANHPQITYYFLLAMSAFWISEGIAAFREKHLGDFWKRTAVLAAAGILAAGSNFSPLWYTASHSKETMRGGSELASTSETSQDGLTLDYATAWSYGRTESLNLLVPDFMGRESGTAFAPDGEVAAVLNDYGLRGAAQQLPAYWGTQPYTGGPTYLGAAAIFLAALGVALVRGRNKWWIVAVSALTLLLAWGRNLMWFTELAFDWLPGYNKFRTVSMALVVVQWTVPLLGALALMRLWRDEIPRRRLFKALGWAAGVTGGLCLLLAVAGGSLFDFGREESAAMMTEQFHQILKANNMQEYLDRGMDAEMGIATADEYFGPLTVVGGTIRKEGDRLVQTMDSRWPTSITAEEITAALTKLTDNIGATFENTLLMVPFLVKPDDPEIQVLQDAFQFVTGDTEHKPFTIGGGTYAREFKKGASFGVNMPWIENPDWVGGEHGPDEGVSEELLKTSFKIYVLALAELQGLKIV